MDDRVSILMVYENLRIGLEKLELEALMLSFLLPWDMGSKMGRFNIIKCLVLERFQMEDIFKLLLYANLVQFINKKREFQSEFESRTKRFLIDYVGDA